MEAVGLAASIVALVELAKVTSTAIYKFQKAYRHANTDLSELRKELVALIDVLERLGIDIKEDEENDQSIGGKATLAIDDGPLSLCADVLHAILKKLPKKDEKLDGLKKILWPFKDGDIKDYLIKLERAKSVLELSLVAEQSILVKEIRKFCEDFQRGALETLDTVKYIRAEQSELKGIIVSHQMSREEEEIINWLLGDLDHVENHENARKLHQEGTGAWFVEGDDFSDWLDGNKSLIWLYGIPGAGKTILMSTIIATALENLETRADTITAYFYFSFAEEAKKKTCNMLKSILAQLGQKVSPFPAGLTSLYKRCGKRSKYSNCPELVKEIKSLCKPKQVYIFLDALDECAKDEQSDLFEALEELSQSCKLIVTSREEADIKQALEEQSFHPISIQSSLVDHDIRIFVKEITKNDQGIRRLPEKAKQLILDKLTSGAKGMFRWVECQVAPLKKCRNTVQVIKVLEKLPKTLYETYDRILENTPEEDRDYLRRALAWIMYSKEPLNAVELAEAMVVEPGAETINEDNRLGALPEEEPAYWRNETEEIKHFVSTIQSICGSLVRVEQDYSSTHKFSLAHYSVQEYLTSDTIASGPLKQFSLDNDDGNAIILESCVTYLQFDDFDDVWSADSIQFPLYHYVSGHWHEHVTSPNDSSLMSQLEKFLQTEPESGQFHVWRRSSNYHLQFGAVAINWKADSDGVLFHMARLGMTAIVKELLSRDTPSDTALHSALCIAAERDRDDVIKVLVDIGGADVHAYDDRGFTPIHLAVESGSIKALSVLVERAKNLEIRSQEFGLPGHTPLEMAALYAYSDEAMLILLKAGAEHSAPEKHPLLHRTAMDQGISRVKHLMEYGVNIEIVDESGETLYRKLISISHGIPVRKPFQRFDDWTGDDPEASRGYNSDLGNILQLLHDRGADPAAGGPLITELEHQMAMMRYETDQEGVKKRSPTVFPAIQSHKLGLSIPFVCSQWNDTAITYAIRHGFTDLLAKMVEQGADLKDMLIATEPEKDIDGVKVPHGTKTPLVYALKRHDAELASFLLDHGGVAENWLASIPKKLASNAADLAWYRRDVDLLKRILDCFPGVTMSGKRSLSLPLIIDCILHGGTINERDSYQQWINLLVEKGSKVRQDGWMEQLLESRIAFYAYEEWKAELLRPILDRERLDLESAYNPHTDTNYFKLVRK